MAYVDFDPLGRLRRFFREQQKQKAQANIEREKKIGESPKVAEQAQVRLIAAHLAKASPPGTTAEQLTSKAAETVRKMRASGQLPPASNTKKLREQLESFILGETDPVEKKVRELGKKAMSFLWNRVINPLTEQSLGRTLGAIKEGAKAASTEMEKFWSKRLGIKDTSSAEEWREKLSKTYAKEKFTPSALTDSEYRKAVVNALRAFAKEAAKTAFTKEGPKGVLEKDWLTPSQRKVSEKVIGPVGTEALEIGFDLAVGSKVDPTNLIGIAPKALSKAKSLEEILKREKQAREAEQKISELTTLIRSMKDEKKRLSNLLTVYRKEAESAQKFLKEVRPKGKDAKAAREAIQKYQDTLKKIRSLSSEIRKSQEELKNTAKLVDTLRTMGTEWALRIGPVEIGLSKVGNKAGRIWRDVASKIPGAEWARSFFKPASLSYKYKPTTFEEAEDLARTKKLVWDWARRGQSEADFVGRQTAKSIRDRIPNRDVRQQGGFLEKFAKAAEEEKKRLLSEMDPEIRKYVQELENIRKMSDEEVQHLLKKLFGPNMEYFYGDSPEEAAKFFLEGYLPLILKDKPEVIEAKLDALSKDLAKRTLKRVPGAKPSFVYERTIPTIEKAKKLGLHPEEDVAILLGAHRAQVERLITLKQMTDYLEAKGYVKPTAKVLGKGWKDAGAYFPWLKGKSVHPEIAEVFDNLRGMVTGQPEAVKPLFKAFWKVTSYFKPLVTLFRPQYYMYNALGNIAMSMMAGMKEDEIPTYIAKGVRMILAPKTEEEKALAEYFRRYGLDSQGLFGTLESSPQVAEQLRKYLEALESQGFDKAKNLLKHPVETLGSLARGTDTMFRAGMFRYFVDKGYTPWEAAQLVKRYLFDYSDLSQAERIYARGIFPFYTWTRYAIPRAILGPIENPHYANMMAYILEKSRQEAGVKAEDLPPNMQYALILGKDEQGKITYLPLQPPEDTLMQLVGSLAEEGYPGLTRQLGWMLNPAIKLPMEYIFGLTPTGEKPTLKEAFIKALTEVVPYANLRQTLGAVLPTDKAGIPRTVESAVPFPTGNESWLTMLLKMIGRYGAPVYKYDQPYAEARELERLKNQLDTLVKDKYPLRYKTEVPTAGEVQQEISKLDKAAMTAEVKKEIRTDEWKSKLLYIVSMGNPERAVRLVEQYPELFYGSKEEVKKRMRNLFTPENIIAVSIVLGREAKPYDIIEHAKQIESGEIYNQLPPALRKFAKAHAQAELERRAEESGGTRAIQPPPAPSTGGVLTSVELNSVIEEARRITGVPQSWVPYLRWLAWAESKYDPAAVGPLDRGEHPLGLMQVKPSTFRQFALKGYDDIYNPLHNMIAAIRYIKWRYGSPENIPNIGNEAAYSGY